MTGRCDASHRVPSFGGRQPASALNEGEIMTTEASQHSAGLDNSGSRSAVSGTWGRTVVAGLVAGVVAALVMAMFAMVAAATYQGSGFFTPLYHIASVFLAPSTMMTSMQHAMSGSEFYFTAGPALVGAVVHMMVGAMYGVIFALLARLLKLSGGKLVLAGMVWGLVVFALSSWIALPLAAAVLGSGAQIAHMASMVGYPTFIVEHLMFGLVLGLVLRVRRTA